MLFCLDPRGDSGRIRVIQEEWEVTDGPLCLLAPGGWRLSPFPLSALGAGEVLISQPRSFWFFSNKF